MTKSAFIMWVQVVTAVLSVAAIIVFIALHAADSEEDRWLDTCHKLSADLIKGPDGRVCARNGEVIYP